MIDLLLREGHQLDMPSRDLATLMCNTVFKDDMQLLRVRGARAGQGRAKGAGRPTGQGGRWRGLIKGWIELGRGWL